MLLCSSNGHYNCVFVHPESAASQRNLAKVTLCRLMDLIDKDMAQSVRYLAGELSHETGPFSSGGPPVTAPGLLNKLGTADR